jgi:hypothetical protein
MLAALALIWTATLMMLWRGGPAPQVPQRFMYELRRLENANPEAEAASALAHGDHRLVVLERGDGQHIPGVTAPDARTRYGVKVVPYLFETATGKNQQQLQHAAFQYAFNYNVFILKKLAPVTTAPTQQP